MPRQPIRPALPPTPPSCGEPHRSPLPPEFAAPQTPARQTSTHSQPSPDSTRSKPDTPPKMAPAPFARQPEKNSTTPVTANCAGFLEGNCLRRFPLWSLFPYVQVSVAIPVPISCQLST